MHPVSRRVEWGLTTGPGRGIHEGAVAVRWNGDINPSRTSSTAQDRFLSFRSGQVRGLRPGFPAELSLRRIFPAPKPGS